MRRQQERGVPVVPDREVDRILPLPGANLSDRVAHGRSRGLERIAAKRGDRILPLPVTLLPTRLGDAELLPGLQVPARDAATLRFAPDPARIGRILRSIEAVAAVDREPVRAVRLATTFARPAPA